jgi:hypothetical protein
VENRIGWLKLFRSFLFCFWVSIVVAAFPAYAEERHKNEIENKNILILNAMESNIPAFEITNRGLSEALQAGGIGIRNQYYEHLDQGRSGTGYLKVDGEVVATQMMEKTVPMLMQWCESFDVGADTGSPVADEDYQPPFRFTGKLDKLTLTIDRPKLSPEDIQKLKMAMNANPASE